MKYLKTKDAVTLILNSKMATIGIDDPRYELALKIIEGEEPLESLGADGSQTHDLGDFNLEVDWTCESVEVYSRGKYSVLPKTTSKWVMDRITKHGITPVSKLIRAIVRSDLGTNWWDEKIDAIHNFTADGRLIFEKNDEDELDGVTLDRIKAVRPVTNRADSNIRLVIVSPDDVTEAYATDDCLWVFVTKRYSTME